MYLLFGIFMHQTRLKNLSQRTCLLIDLRLCTLKGTKFRKISK